MKPLLFILIVVAAVISMNARADTVTIINTSDHPVVIGVYESTSKGIRETLIPVNKMTEVANVPISYDGNECFAVAYRAESSDGRITRATPTVIHGMQKLSRSHDRKSPKTEETVLQYRAGSDWPERDYFRSNLYTARGEGAFIKEQVERTYGDKIVKTEYAPSK